MNGNTITGKPERLASASLSSFIPSIPVFDGIRHAKRISFMIAWKKFSPLKRRAARASN